MYVCWVLTNAFICVIHRLSSPPGASSYLFPGNLCPMPAKNYCSDYFYHRLASGHHMTRTVWSVCFFVEAWRFYPIVVGISSLFLFLITWLSHILSHLPLVIPGLFQVLEMLVASCKAGCGKGMISCLSCNVWEIWWLQILGRVWYCGWVWILAIYINV